VIHEQTLWRVFIDEDEIKHKQSFYVGQLVKNLQGTLGDTWEHLALTLKLRENV